MRTHYCGLLSFKDINKNVKLCGWVLNIRVLKNIIFINLQDYTGSLQLVILNKDIYYKKITVQSCIRIFGKVIKKDVSNIEILVKKLILLNISKLLPLDIFSKNSENIKFKYRYLDLRNKKILDIFKIRTYVKNIIHNFFYKNKFLEIETPFLTKSFIEGSRSYLVPSRIYLNKYYSLPQSPQIFKQLLMIGGIDKYYQIVKCFRDEDLRSDRQPEFTQLDIELSFVGFSFIKKLIEKLIIKLWYKILNINLNNSFKVIKYNDCLLKYGTDKPDLRNPLKFSRKIYKLLYKYKILYKNNLNNEIILDLFIINTNIRFDFEYLKKFLFKQNINNLFFLKVINLLKDKYIYNILYNFLNLEDKLIQRFLFKLKPVLGGIYFVIFFNFSNKINLLNIRNFFCNYFNLFNKNIFLPLWVIDFPMFYYNNKNKIDVFHHMFTKPKINIKNLVKLNNYNNVISTSYDLVINGFEIGSGSKRIDNVNLQIEIFNILGISKEDQIKNYGFFLEALKYGTPPHIGIALGLDRIIMLLTNKKSIKEVIAFPKTTSGICFLTGSPF